MPGRDLVAPSINPTDMQSEGEGMQAPDLVRPEVEKTVGALLQALDSEAAGFVRSIRQNLLFAFLSNALGVPIAAGVLCTRPSASS
jgi:hypothetical protein